MAHDQELTKYLGEVRQIKDLPPTILDYFKPDTPRKLRTNLSGKLSFFDLPFVVRRRIYKHAGLVEGMTIHLNLERTSESDNLHDDAEEDENYDEDGYGEYPAFYTSRNALQVNQLDTISNDSQQLSKFIYNSVPHPYIRSNLKYACDDPLPRYLLNVAPRLSEELKALFFSKCLFKVVQDGLGGLSNLRSLDPGAWAYLISLRVHLDFGRLNRARCAARFFNPSRERPICEGKHRSNGRAPDFFSRQGKAKALEWKQLCAYMARYLTPHRLSLHVSAEAWTMDVAREIVVPLIRVGSLKQCSIKISPPSHWDFGSLSSQDDTCLSTRLSEWESLQLTQQTVLALTVKSRGVATNSFRLLDLPLEIQMHILEYTDLVTPHDIAWLSDKWTLGSVKFFELRTLDGFSQLSFADDFDFRCCGHCTHAKRSTPESECCCWVRSSAASSSCTCWRMSPLVCVSQDMHQKAMSIFYSQNHFVILPSQEDRPRPDEMLRFWNSIPPAGQHSLRFVTWICPKTPYRLRDTNVVSSDNVLYQDWIEFVDICARDLDLSNLSLTIDMTLHEALLEEGPQGSLQQLEKEVQSAELSQISNLVAAMTKYKGWGNFAVHLSLFDEEEESEAVAVEKVELDYERRVMGKKFKPWKNGKYDRRHILNGYDCSSACGWGCSKEPWRP